MIGQTNGSVLKDDSECPASLAVWATAAGGVGGAAAALAVELAAALCCPRRIY